MAFMIFIDHNINYLFLETERFFLALSMLGGNFDRMEALFRHRNRKALVKKYHAELKKNPERVDRAMYLDAQVRFDIDKFPDESSGN